jgi:hypothetical protein
MNILPMYAIFILFLPVILKKFFENKLLIVLALSGCVYLLGQLKLLKRFSQFAVEYIPLKLSFFDLFSWQLLFLLGIVAGFMEFRQSHLWKLFKQSHYVLLISVFVIVFCLPFRYGLLPSDSSFFLTLISKPTLGPLRLVNFLSIAFVINFLITHYSNHFFASKWLVYLGKHSLQVFAYHVLLLIVFLPFAGDVKNMGLLLESIFTVVLVASLFIPAFLHKKYTIIAKSVENKSVSA